MDTKSTPSAAMSRSVVMSTPPDTSSGMRPSNGGDLARRTASRRDAASKSSIRIRSQPSASASSSCARVSTSTISGSAGCAARAARIAAVSEPAARTWFSFSITASYRPMRWFCPPPQRTAYFCARRRPGRVLRVSRMVQPVPRTASTYAAVVVAVPDSVCRKFSAVRSAVTRARVRPDKVASTVPAGTRSPSCTRQSMRTSGSSARWQASNHGRPATTASSLQSR